MESPQAAAKGQRVQYQASHAVDALRASAHPTGLVARAAHGLADGEQGRRMRRSPANRIHRGKRERCGSFLSAPYDRLPHLTALECR